MPAMHLKQLAFATGFALFAGLAANTALAAPASDLMTRRITAIGAGDVASLTSAYGDHAILQWVGGPLDGVYSDAGAINTTWGKFATAQHAKDAPLKTEIVDLTEAGNPQGSTVTANLILTGAKVLKVHYVTVWRSGKLVNEIWQINPQATY